MSYFKRLCEAITGAARLRALLDLLWEQAAGEALAFRSLAYQCGIADKKVDDYIRQKVELH